MHGSGEILLIGVDCGEDWLGLVVGPGWWGWSYPLCEYSQRVVGLVMEGYWLSCQCWSETLGS